MADMPSLAPMGFAACWPVYPGQINSTDPILRRDRATGTVGPWDPGTPPQLRIPVDGGTPVLLTASVADDGSAAFTATVDQTAAALAAGTIYWLEAGRITGTVLMLEQP